MGILETRWGYPIPVGYGFGLSFLSPLEFGMGLGKPELYGFGFGFGEGKTRPRPAPLPCLLVKVVHRSISLDESPVPRGRGPSSPEFGASSGIKWFQSSPKCSCRESNRGPPYQVQLQSPLNQLTFGKSTFIFLHR
ncbi:hypothetical protein L195_g058820 [Trifolium pratense]|uniref:Uncharacterized protein n=1 Tax=Trifolium pratense TaxID=57577 RepID=A0A2K3JUI9_TRIPR|nr:hypothetical protein L195_g058820 [Trifolium pratense]